MTKIAGYGSGSVSQRHGSADPDPDPDPPQNVMDPQHCVELCGCLLVEAGHLVSDLGHVLGELPPGRDSQPPLQTCIDNLPMLGDPDPDVFGPPGSGSISQRYESGSFPFLKKVLWGLK
jgi:hypothetical protein